MRSRPIYPRPPAHDEIASIGIGHLFLLDPAADIAYQFNIERPCKTAGDLALRFPKITSIGFEPVGPDMRTALAVNQLHIDLNPVAQPPYAALKHIADAKIAGDLLHLD